MKERAWTVKKELSINVREERESARKKQKNSQ